MLKNENARVYLLLADGTTRDKANSENLAIGIRLINENCDIEERCIGLQKVETPNAANILKSILSLLQNYDIL